MKTPAYVLDFSHFSIRLGDRLTFMPTGADYFAASEGGGCLLKHYLDEPRAYSMRLLTRRLMQLSPGHTPPDDYILTLWLFHGQSLATHLLRAKTTDNKTEYDPKLENSYSK